MKQKPRQGRKYWWLVGWSEWLLALLALALLIRSLVPLVHTGFPATHDGEGHVARLANYAVALRQGQLPPRMAPTFWNGYGYPVFNFHYPLLSMLAAPLVLVGIHPELALVAWVGLAWLAASIGIGIFTGLLTRNRAASLVTVVLFLLHPYFYTLVYVRGSYGELLGIAAFIWLLVVLEWRAQYARKTVTASAKSDFFFKAGLDTVAVIIFSALVLLAHNIYATALYPCAGIYALLRRQQRSFWQVVREFGIGFGLTAFFWIPALLEKKYVMFDAQFSEFYKNHFVAFWQLLATNVTFGVSTSGTADTMSLGMGWASWVVLILGLAYVLVVKYQPSILYRSKTVDQAWWVPVLVPLLIVLLCIVLMLPWAQPIWQYSVILPYYQFPWRFLGFISVALAVVGGYLWSTQQRLLQWILVGAIVVNAAVVSQWYWPSYTHFAPDYYLNYYQTSTIYDELRAKTFTVDPGQLSPGVPQPQAAAEIDNLKWRGTYRTYQVTAPTEVTIVEPTMYFPGWQVRANGTPVELITETSAPELAQKYRGQVAFTLPAGTWQVDSRMTQQTPGRLLGNTITIVCGFYTVWVLGRAVFRARQSRVIS